MLTPATLYDQDFYAWTQQQAARLDARQFAALDIPHLVEEVVSLRQSEQRALSHRLTRLIEQLLKLHLPHDLHRAGRGGRNTVTAPRLELATVLRANPSWRPTVPAELADAYAVPRLEVDTALALEEDVIPLLCPWSAEQVLDAAFWPEEGSCNAEIPLEYLCLTAHTAQQATQATALDSLWNRALLQHC